MINVIIYEDNLEFQQTLSTYLQTQDDIKILGAFENTSSIKQDVEALKPDIIIMDIDMPVSNGLQGLAMLRSFNSEIKVLMLTVFEDDRNIFTAIQNGANGYVLKSGGSELILHALRESLMGGAPMSSSVATQVLRMFRNISQVKKNDLESYNLSSRESEVLNLLVEGYSYKMIAAELFLSIDTVRSHMKSIYEKMHVNSKGEAISKVLKKRL